MLLCINWFGGELSGQAAEALLLSFFRLLCINSAAPWENHSTV